jgi:uncharacterized membrane protein
MEPLPFELIQLIDNINRFIINPIIGTLTVIALFLFIWGGIEFIRNADSSTGRETGKQHMMWGLVGLFVMVSSFALIRVGLDTFRVDSGSDFPSEIPL